MEALENLKNIQTMLSWMQEHDLSSNHHNSDRFLADFLLFMAKSGGELGMEKKLHLISDLLPKVSPEFLKEAAVSLTGEDYQHYCVQHPSEPILETKRDHGSVRNDFEDTAMVGLDAMQRANSTLEDFCRSYFMFHEMDVNRPQSVFRYLPVLSFTESYIYQLDNLNEDILSLSGTGVIGDASKMERNPRLTDHFVKALKNDPFRPLILLFGRHGLLTERIEEELQCGDEYWVLERKLCCALTEKKEILIEDVMRAIHLKSFDYRVLNLLLYQLRKEQVNDLFMEFLSTSEFLVEICDDLFDYEDDIIKNSFNILRMFVAIYGASMAPVMLAKVITEAEEKYERLLNSLDHNLSLSYWRRCKEATEEGGDIKGHALGNWTIPSVIANEELYRSKWAVTNKRQDASLPDSIIHNTMSKRFAAST